MRRWGAVRLLRTTMYAAACAVTADVAVAQGAVQLTLTEPLNVVPAGDQSASGPAGGPFTPIEQVYTLTYDGDAELPWRATYTTADGASWLSLDGGTQASGVISQQGGTADVAVTVNGTAAGLLPGVYSATVVFEDLATSSVAERGIDLLVAEGGFTVPMALVAGAGQDEPGGPTHDFRIGVHEITNAEFAGFLNSTINSLGHPRGAYLYHDIDSGDLFLSAGTNGLGAIGTNGSGTRMFRASDGRAISYDAGAQGYVVASGLEDWPVVGVSRYGAAKFCNWMTLAQGMDGGQRIYNEGPDPGDWQAAGAAADVAGTLAGFRLPMDDGAGAATAYNEWYKAAAWLPGAATHAAYGFGRNALTQQDANYTSSGDPYEADSPPLSPVRFYDGLNVLDDGLTPTLDTGNGYGLYDLCGNVAEWVHLAGRTRGGNAFNPSTSAQLRADTAAVDAPGATRSTTGFRVAQSVLATPLEVSLTSGSLVLAGVVGGPMDAPGEAVFSLAASPQSSGEWQITTDVTWLEVNGIWANAGVLPPGGQQDVSVALNALAATMLTAGDYEAEVIIGDLTTETDSAFTMTLTLREAFTVDGSGADLNASGPFRGAQPPAAEPFNPMSASYTLTNESATTMSWQVSAAVGWIDVEVDTNGTDPAGLGMGEQVLVDVILNDAARDLLPGLHSGSVSFANLTTGSVSTKPVSLLVTDAVRVTARPSAGFDLSGHAALTGCLTGPGGGLLGGCDGHDLDGDLDVDLADHGAWAIGGSRGFSRADDAMLAHCLTGPAGGPLNEYGAAYDFDDDDDLDLADYAVYARAVGQGDLVAAGLWGGPFASASGQANYTLLNLLDIPLNYAVSSDANWITLGGDPLTGTFGSWPDSVWVTTAINSNADALDVGRYVGAVAFAYEDAGIGTSEARTVWLYVNDLLQIVEPDDTAGTYSPAYEPPSDPQIVSGGAYTIDNLSDSQQVAWQVAGDRSWVTVNGDSQASGDLLPGGQATVLVGFAEEAGQLAEGVHTATLTFSDLWTGFATTRRVDLTVDESLRVTPMAGLDAFGTVGQQVAPERQDYTLTNLTDAPLGWRVALANAQVTWVLIDAGPEAFGTLASGASTDVTVSIDQEAAADQLTTVGPHQAQVLFINETDALTVGQRLVTVTLTGPFDARAIPGADAQPGGPAYDYEMAVYEVTNAEFAAFLSDAFNNLANERGYYLYHDIDSGDVYLNTSQAGGAGTTGSDTLTVRVYSASANGNRITYAGGPNPYVVTAGYERHPVTGVSWYGALKYCNWLTIEQGLGLAQRCYNEGLASDLSEWRPVTIARADSQGRDLNDGERQALVSGYRGFRLPMDDGRNNADPWSDAADAYNEWYKAAAWDQAAGVNWAFAFRSNSVGANGENANYWDSGDPFDNGTTPAGFFGIDGLRTWDDPTFGWLAQPPASFAVLDAASYYGLYDLSGNVAEWVQDRYAGLNTRALRGGSWSSLAAQGVWIRTFDRDFASPSLAWNTIGFRVVRVASAPGG